MSKKRGRLTRFVSYLYRHKYLDEDCFAEGEINDDDFLEGGEEMDKAQKRQHAKDVAGDIMATTVIVGGCIAATMVACSAVYYTCKGTVGLFKAIGHIGSRVINR